FIELSQRDFLRLIDEALRLYRLIRRRRHVLFLGSCISGHTLGRGTREGKTQQSNEENDRRFHDWPPCSIGITAFERQILPTLARPPARANVSFHSIDWWDPVILILFIL